MTINGKTVYCDCCGNQKLAEIVGDNLVIKDRRHGEKHLAVVPLISLLDVIPKKTLIDKMKKEGYILRNNNLRKGTATETVKSDNSSAVPAMV